jgi:hypothetical protein
MKHKDTAIYSDLIPMSRFEGFTSLYSTKRHEPYVNYYVGDIVRRFEDNSPNPQLYRIVSVMKTAYLYGGKLKSKHRIQVCRVKDYEKITYTKNFPFVPCTQGGAIVD